MMTYTFARFYSIALLVSSAWAADQTWTGQISDSVCGPSHAQMIERKNKELQTTSAAPDRDCTLACLKDKAKYVFVVDGKVYKIANQNFGSLQTRAGQTVRLSGDLQNDTITVSKIAAPQKK